MPALETQLNDEFGARAVMPGTPIEGAENIRVAVTSGRNGMKAELLEQLPNLELVANFGVGYDGNDTDALKARGVALTNTPDVLNACVADTALSLLLNAFRRFPDSERFTRAGKWAAGGNYPLTRRFSGSTIGILGMGRIGADVAQRVEAFGCKVLYHNRREVPHVGSGTVETRNDMKNLVLDNVRAQLAGEPLVTPVEF